MNQQKRILDFNFSTKILFKITPTKYASGFAKGKIKFSQPKTWIEFAKDGNNRQGDYKEGVFLACSKDDNSDFIMSLINNKNLDSFVDNDLRYFRNIKSLNSYCFCVYGLHDNAFVKEEIDRFGQKHYIATVKKEYFDDFLDDKQLEINSVIFITNPHEFFERIRKFFYKIGVKSDEIIISPIEYIEINKQFISMVPYPLELLTKDISYINQSEVRIIVSSKNKNFMDYMKNNNGVIDIGNISDISMIHENYSNDLLLEIEENSLKYNLPRPEYIPLKELPPEQLIGTYKQIIDDRMPSKMNEEDEKSLLNEIEKILLEKYNITIKVNR